MGRSNSSSLVNLTRVRELQAGVQFRGGLVEKVAGHSILSCSVGLLAGHCSRMEQLAASNADRMAGGLQWIIE